jgi:hypothetical protein
MINVYVMLNECEEFARWIYRNEEQVDIEGAVVYWQSMPLVELVEEHRGLRERALADGYAP